MANSELRSLEPASRRMIIARRDLQQRLFDRVVQDGVEQAILTTGHPKEASRALVTMCSAVARWYDPKGPASMEDITARYQDMALDLVGYRPPAKRRRPSPRD